MRLSRVVLVAFAVVIGMPACSPLAQSEVPTFVRDESWPKPLPDNWRLGIVWGVGVDPNDHVWVFHAPDNYRSEIDDEGKVPAPPVLEFDPEGNLLRHWGGRDQGHPWFYRMDNQRMSRVDEHPHPVREHALSVDHEGNIWLSGGGHLVLKFSPDGEFLLQLGELGMTGGSNHTEYLGNPASVDFDPRTNEVYVADGYLNKRVIVFDMYSGEYKRHWGRYGETPDDAFEPGSIPAWSGEYAAPTGFFPRFGHGVNVANDGLVYVADRAHTLLHVYEPDGTFIEEAPTPGPINSVAFSHDAEQEFVYGAGLNAAARIYIMRRDDLEVVGEFESTGQHYFDVDSQGNLYTCGLFMPVRFELQN